MRAQHKLVVSGGVADVDHCAVIVLVQAEYLRQPNLVPHATNFMNVSSAQ